MATGVAPPMRAGRLRTSRRTLAAAWVVVAIVTLAICHVAVGQYQLQLLGQAFIFGIAAISLDLVWGYTGVPDLGHALWFGIGALSVGVATTSVSSTGLSSGTHGGFVRYATGVVVGIVAAGAVAWLVARFSFFTSAVVGSAFYIAVVTLALTTAATTVYTQVEWTGGDNGLSGFQLGSVTVSQWFFIAGALLLVVMVAAWVLVSSDFGLLMRAVRDNERRTRYLAYNVEGVKTSVFVLGAAGAALAGAVYSLSFGLVSSSLFSFLLATEMLVWVAVGGRSTIIGPAIGAIAMTLIGSKLDQRFPSQWALVEGALFVAVVVFIPDGVFPYVARATRRVIGRRFVTTERSLVLDDGKRKSWPEGGVAISIRDLHFSYGELRVLQGVDLDINFGELLCIVGPNGAGKSTLMEVLTDGTRKHSGTITVNLGDQGHAKRPAHRIARAGIVRKFQIPSLFHTLTVAETILLATNLGSRRSPWRRTTEVAVRAPVLDVVDAVGLAGRENVLSAQLSHGLRQGLEIATVVATDPGVLILDEPTAGLTAGERHVIGAILRRLVARGMSVVLIEHDLDFVQRVADRVAVLHEGRVIETGTPQEVSASDVVRGAYVGTTLS